jgi:CelD/BcsL family acetyltransferase involved in cellulose biosynthesis/peptidoglycan/xylan/chitin deacetylase (PgdA/CDA1 family)
MKLDVIEDAAGLDAVEGPWERLVEEDAGDGVFLRHAWVSAWWRAYGAHLGGRLHVVCLWDGDGALVGAAPFYLAPGRGLGGCDEVRFLGAGGDTSPDYLSVLARSGREAEVADTVAAHLRGGHRRRLALHLTDMADDALMTDQLERALEVHGTRLVRRVPDAVCPYVTLSHSPDLLRRVLPHSLGRVMQARRKLEREQRARFFLWNAEGEPAGSVTAGMALLAELHRRRFAERDEPHAFATTAYRTFHEEAAGRYHRLGLLRLYCLEAAGQVVAMLYCFRHRDCVYCFQAGFDPAWKRAMAGQVLLSHTLEHAIAEGVRRYDFLKGDYDYKAEWASGRRATVCLTGACLSPAGVCHLARTWARPLASAALARLRQPGFRLREALGTAVGLGPRPTRRQVAKLAVATILYRTGALRAGLGALRLVDPDPRAVVLAYHHVAPRHELRPAEESAVSRENLASQARVLARLFDRAPADRTLAALRAPPRRRGRYPLLITFDDGRESVHRHAWPTLRREGFPVVFFVVAGVVGTDDFIWTDEVTELLLAARCERLRISLAGHEESFALGDHEARLDLAVRLKGSLKRLEHAELTAAIGALRTALGGQRVHHHQGTRAVDWAELRQAHAQGATIGCHSLTHPILSRVPGPELSAEIAGAQRRLEERLEHPVDLFAYPNGLQADLDRRVLAEVAAAGYSHAFTIAPRTATGRDHRLLVPRIAPEDVPGAILGLDLVRLLAADVAASWRQRAGRPARAPVVDLGCASAALLERLAGTPRSTTAVPAAAVEPAAPRHATAQE